MGTAATHCGPPPPSPRQGCQRGECWGPLEASPPASHPAPWSMATAIAGGKGLVPAPPRAPLSSSPAGWQGGRQGRARGVRDYPHISRGSTPGDGGSRAQPRRDARTGCWVPCGPAPILTRLRVPASVVPQDEPLDARWVSSARPNRTDACSCPAPQGR